MRIVADIRPRHEAATLTQADEARRRALLAARIAEENRGRDIVILDLRELDRHVRLLRAWSAAPAGGSCTPSARRSIGCWQEELGDRRLGIEGYAGSRWILLDYGDVVIHLFEPETRRYYALEDLWAGGQAGAVRAACARRRPSLARPSRPPLTVQVSPR